MVRNVCPEGFTVTDPCERYSDSVVMYECPDNYMLQAVGSNMMCLRRYVAAIADSKCVPSSSPSASVPVKESASPIRYVEGQVVPSPSPSSSVLVDSKVDIEFNVTLTLADFESSMLSDDAFMCRLRLFGSKVAIQYALTDADVYVASVFDYTTQTRFTASAFYLQDGVDCEAILAALRTLRRNLQASSTSPDRVDVTYVAFVPASQAGTLIGDPSVTSGAVVGAGIDSSLETFATQVFGTGSYVSEIDPAANFNTGKYDTAADPGATSSSSDSSKRTAITAAVVVTSLVVAGALVSVYAVQRKTKDKKTGKTGKGIMSSAKDTETVHMENVVQPGNGVQRVNGYNNTKNPTFGLEDRQMAMYPPHTPF
jgi:hypothetical protein